MQLKDTLNTAALYHRNDSEFCYLADDETIVLRLRAAKNTVKKAMLIYGDRFSEKVETTPDGTFPPVCELPMRKVGAGKVYDYFEARFKPGFPRVQYMFCVANDCETKWFNVAGAYDEMPKLRNECWQIPYMRREEVYRVPSWAQSSVMYQIFPDSFATEKNAFVPRKKVHIPFQSAHCETLHGGTLAGIIENVAYLASLGIDCVYLNPIFPAVSYHKYDTIDYKSIDPCFGTEAEFCLLVKRCHEKNIRIILDGVFNHSSMHFFAFQDILKNQEKSAYKDWYYEMKLPLKSGWDNEYACFGHVKAMPKLNTGNPALADYFCEVGKYWIREYAIDGWRLDVANEVDHEFWRLFKKAVRSEKADAILIGEIWEDAQNWLVYDQFDSAMNYRFTDLCKGFFAHKTLSAQDAAECIVDMHMRYPWEVTCAQMNLLDSHDVSRFLAICKEDVALLKAATVLQMTIPGFPSIFAGAERAMSGKEEKDFRVPFTWDKNIELANWFSRLIHLRKSHAVFVQGEIHFYRQKSDVLVFSRCFDTTDQTECLFTVLNARNEEQTCNVYSDADNPDSALLFSASIPAKTGCIFDIHGNIVFI